MVDTSGVFVLLFAIFLNKYVSKSLYRHISDRYITIKMLRLICTRILILHFLHQFALSRVGLVKTGGDTYVVAWLPTTCR